MVFSIWSGLFCALTLKQLVKLKKQGANIIFEGLPDSVPGFDKYEEQSKALKQILKENIKLSNDVYSDLNDSKVFPETLVETGLKYIRRDAHGNKIYYLVNHTAKAVDQYIPVNINNKEVIIFDPNTSDYGKAQTKKQGDITLVKVQIKPGQSLFLKSEVDFTLTLSPPLRINKCVSFLSIVI